MNPLAFSTLGCPAWTLDEIVDNAVRFGYDALELRGYRDQMDLPLAEPFTPAHRAETRRRIEDAGLSVCCVSSSGVVAKANDDHVASHAALARDLGCPAVRVFGGSLPEGGLTQSAENLRRFGDIARAEGVAIVLETHDAFSTGATVAELLALADHPAVFSLWDLHHPYRQNEPIAETHRLLGPTLRHVHIKDGKDGAYTMMGEGDVPLVPMLDLLVGGGYTGPISLEWEKRWHPEIADPQIAFPQYADAIRAYFAARGE